MLTVPGSNRCATCSNHSVVSVATLVAVIVLGWVMTGPVAPLLEAREEHGGDGSTITVMPSRKANQPGKFFFGE